MPERRVSRLASRDHGDSVHWGPAQWLAASHPLFSDPVITETLKPSSRMLPLPSRAPQLTSDRPPLPLGFQAQTPLANQCASCPRPGHLCPPRLHCSIQRCYFLEGLDCSVSCPCSLLDTDPREQDTLVHFAPHCPQVRSVCGRGHE